MKTTVNRVLSVLFVLSLMLTLLLPAMAAPAEAGSNDAISTIWAVNSSNSVVAESDCVVVLKSNGSGTYVYADSDFYEKYKGDNKFFVKTGETSGYRLTWEKLVSSENKLCRFSTSVPSGDVRVLKSAQAKDGSVKFHCYKLNGNSATQEIYSATISGGSDRGDWIDLQVSAPQGTGNVTNNNTKNYAIGALLNSNDALVGIYTPGGKFITTEELGGYAGSSSAPAPAPAPDPEPTEAPAPAPAPDPTPAPDPAPTDEPSGRDPDPAPSQSGETPAETTSNSDDKKNDEDDDEISWTVVAIVGGVAVLLVVAVAVFVVLKNKNSGPKGGGNTYYPPTGPMTSQPPEPPVYVPPQPPQPPQPPVYVPPVIADPPVSSSSAMYLYGVGGAMNGRRYQISTSEITFGRELNNVISFPADTKGVSRYHCKLFWHKGVLMIMDLGSTYGTFFHGKGQIPANKPFPIHVGDTFYLGEKKNGFTIREN